VRLVVADDLGVENESMLVVGIANRAPLIVSVSPEAPVALKVSESKAFAVVANDPDGDALTYSWTIDGMSTDVSASTYTFVGTDAGNYSLTVIASDGLSSAGHTWNAEVRTDPGLPVPPPDSGVRRLSVAGVAVFAALALTGAVVAWILRQRTR
jgi:chitinase